MENCEYNKTKDGFLLKQLRKKYANMLDTVSGCQYILKEILKENKGKIMHNPTYHTLDARCQEMITNFENKGEDVSEYRKTQEKLEKLTSRINKPEIPEKIRKIKQRINIYRKTTGYEKQKHRSDIEIE